MGALQQIRKISPYVFGIFAFLLVAFFTIGDPTVIDGLKGLVGGAGSQVLGKVNGVEIVYTDYENRVKEEEENQRRQMIQQGQEPNIDNNMIRQRVWDMFVDEILLNQELEKFGIMISDKTIQEQMIDNPPDFLKKSFTDSAGVFNRQLYIELITNPENYAKYLGDQMPLEQKQEAINNFRKDLVNIEKYIKQNLQQQELQAAVAVTKAMITPTFAKSQYRNEKSSANVNFLALTFRDIQADKIEVTKEEIEKYYQQNKQYFKQKAQRKLKYIAIPIVASLEDTLKAQKRVDNIVNALNSATTDAEKDSIFEIKLNEYNGTTYDYQMVSDINPQILTFLANVPIRGVVGPIYRPDGIMFYRLDDKRSGENIVVKASHILINFDKNKDSAKSEANKILAEAKKNPNSFSELASKYSKDPGSASRGGDLGYFGKGTMVKPFEDAAFAAKVGDIVGPVESQFGYHIIKVEDRKSEDLKYSEIKIVPTLSSATRSKIFRDAKSIEQQLLSGQNIDSLAKKLNLRVAESPLFRKNNPALGSRYLSSVAFEKKLGDVIEPIELERYGVVIAKVIEIKEDGISSLDDVRMEISQKLGKIKQLDAMKEKMNELYNKVKNYGSLKQAVDSDTSLMKYFRTIDDFKYSQTIQGFGQDAAFAPKVFAMELNKISEPFRGENGYFIIEVTNKSIPTDEEINKELNNYIQNLQIQAKTSIFYQWFQSVKENAKIEDYRSKFYRDF